MRLRTRRTALYGSLVIAALLLGPNAVSVSAIAADGDAKGTSDQLRRWADYCTKNSDDCAAQLYNQEFAPGQLSSPAGEALQWKVHCKQNRDDCAIRLFGASNFPPNAADEASRRDYCSRYPADCIIRLYKYEHRSLSTVAPHILAQWIEYCSRDRDPCTPLLNEWEPFQANSAGQQGCVISESCPAPVSQDLKCPFEPCPVSEAAPPPPSQSHGRTAPPPKGSLASQWEDIAGLGLILGALILLVLAWRFIPAHINWRRLMPNDAIWGSIKALQDDMRKLRNADRDALKAEIRGLVQNELDEFKRLLLAEMRAEFDRLRDDGRSPSAQPLGGSLAYDPPVERPAYDRPRELDRSGLRSPEDLRREYDRAIRERSAAKRFTDGWQVVGLIKLEGKSVDGNAVLAKSTEADPEKWPFWAVKADKGVTAVLPGRYQFLHASALGADGGEVGNERIGQVFEIVDGSDFNLRQLAKAVETDGGFEICEKGQLELPRSRG